MIKYILFDTDGVLVHSDTWSSEYARRSGLPINVMKPFFTGIFQDCLIGKVDLKEVLGRYVSSWNWRGSVDEFLQSWFEYENNVDTAVLNRVKELRQIGIGCYVLTNQEKYRLSYLRNEMGFARLFDGVFCSAEIGYKKPEKEFFEYILQQLGIQNPEECMYFDDSVENISSARSLGIPSTLYRGFDDIRRLNLL